MPSAGAGDELRALLRELATADAPGLVAEARLAARGRARALIEDLLVEELLRAARAPQRPAGRSQETAPAPAPAPPTLAPETPADGDAWWAYCIVRAAEAKPVLSQVEGVEPGTSVEMVDRDGVAALVSRVPLAEYNDRRLREHLEDIEWVEQIARAHEAVLERVLAQATIVPLRLCTLYRDVEGVRRLLRDRRSELLQCIVAIDGCTEWGVKVFATRQTEPGGEVSDTMEASGADYLTQRRQERELAERAWELEERCSEEVHERVGAVAREARVNPPQVPEAHGRDAAMLLNGAYLIERAAVDRLHEVVLALREEWEPQGFSIEPSGPWPPYNFVSAPAGMVA